MKKNKEAREAAKAKRQAAKKAAEEAGSDVSVSFGTEEEEPEIEMTEEEKDLAYEM
jgi:hypothetical protein